MIKILSSFNYIGLKNWEEMKPTTAETPSSSSTGSTTPKSTAISLKKAAKSRTKNPRKRPVSGLSSSSANASDASDGPSTPNTGNSSVEPTTPSKEERVPQSSTSHHNHKNFPAFPARTVQTIYEQWDKDAEPTELHTEVFPRLAEDLSYRMWEIVNVMKSFARHSGGRLTCDIVNEVFKDCQVPPAYGAHDGNNDWIEIEEEKPPFHFLVPGGESAERDCFYVNNDTDRILNLGEEYMKPLEFPLPSVDLQLSGTWQVDKKHIDVLLEFVENLVNGALLGNKECMTYTLQITYSAPFIGPVFKAILKELLKVLAFNQTELIIKRGLTFLKTLAQNEHIRDVIGDCRSEFFNLAELFVNFLIGAGDALLFGHPLRHREKAMEILTVVAKEKGFSVDSMSNIQKALDDPDIKKKCDVAFEYCNYIEYRQLLEADRLVDNRKYKRLKEMEEANVDTKMVNCDDSSSSSDDVVKEDIPEEERFKRWEDVIETADNELSKEFNALFNSGNFSKNPPSEDNVNKNEMKPDTADDDEEDRDKMILMSLVRDELRKVKKQESLKKTYISGDLINRRNFDVLDPLKNDFYVEPDPHSEDELEESMAYDYKKLNDSFSSSNSNKCSLFRGAVLNLESAFLLCETMGHLGAQFTYFQTECLQGILQRLDIFFRLNNANNNKTTTNHFKKYFEYYEFLVRAINGLICLGEYAFREFLPYCHMVEYKHFPEVFLSFVSQAAVFLKGQDDIFFYEWLEEVCGDRIQPFMLYKYKYHQYLTTKWYKLQKPPTFKIMPKVRFKILPRMGEIETSKLNHTLTNFSDLLQPFNLDFHLVPNLKMEIDDIDYTSGGIVGGRDQDKSRSSSLTTNHSHHISNLSMNMDIMNNSSSKPNLKKLFFPNYSPVLNRPLKFHFKFSGCRPTATERNRNPSSISMSTNMNSNFSRNNGNSSSCGNGSNRNSISGSSNHHIFHNNFNSSSNINHYGSNININNNNNNNNSNCNNVNDNFRRKIVVARGRLLKPLSDRKKFVNLSNYCFVQI